jgi:hypothetical protein
MEETTACPAVHLLGGIKGLLSGGILRQDKNRGLKGDEVVRGGRWHPAFELKVRHCALDDAGMGPPGPLRQAAGRAVTQEALYAQIRARAGASWAASRVVIRRCVSPKPGRAGSVRVYTRTH